MKKTAIILLVLFTAAFAVRLGYNVFVAGLNTSPSVYYGADDGDYDAIGWNLVSGKGYSITPGELTADRTPGYPLFLSALYKIFGRSYPAVRIVQSLLGALSCLLIYIIAKRVFGHGTALLAAAIYCVYPFAVYYTELVYTETLFISLLLLFVLCMMKIKSQANSLYFLFCGLLLGYLTLVKPQMLIFFPVMAAWFFFNVSRNVKIFFKFFSLALAGFMIMLMPWFARNYLVFKEPWLMRAAAGEGVLVAINDIVYRNFNERYFISPLEIEGVPEMIRGLDNIERDKAYMRLAKEYIRKHPGRAAVLMGLHLRQLFGPIPLSKVKDRWIVMLSYGLLLPFMALGFILSLKYHKELIIIYLIIIVNMLSAAVYGGSSRYRQPIEPFLIMFAAYSFICIGSYIARNMPERKGRLTAGAG